MVAANILVRSISWIFEIASFLIIARALMSWIFPYDSNNIIARYLFRATEPILAPIRGFLRQNFNYRLPVDISPIIAILFLIILRRLCITMIGLIV